MGGGGFRHSDTFNLAEKLPLWATLQFSLKRYDICSGGGPTSTKKEKGIIPMKVTTVVSQMYESLQYSHAKQLNSELYHTSLMLFTLCCSSAVLCYLWGVFFLGGGVSLSGGPGQRLWSLHHLLKTKKVFQWVWEHRRNSLWANGPSLTLTFFFCGVPTRQGEGEIVFWHKWSFFSRGGGGVVENKLSWLP